MRQTLGNPIAVSADLSGCVLMTPPGLWQEMLPMLQGCAAADHQAKELFRFYAASETPAKVDGRGRVTIPQLHMEWARLAAGGPVVVVALGRTARVWEPRRLALHLRMANKHLRSLESRVLREQLRLLEV